MGGESERPGSSDGGELDEEEAFTGDEKSTAVDKGDSTVDAGGAGLLRGEGEEGRMMEGCEGGMLS